MKDKVLMTIKDLKDILNSSDYQFEDDFIIEHLELSVRCRYLQVNIEHVGNLNWTCSRCNHIKKVHSDKRIWICESCL